MSEMDRKVGTDVFGYWVYHYDKDIAERCYYMLMDTAMNPAVFQPDYWQGGGRCKTEEEAWATCPAFSEDIAAAWKIVDVWQGKGYHWSVATNWYGQIAVNVWRIEGESHYEHRMAFMTADTVPLAICAAGLMVAEAEKVVMA